MPNFDGTKQRLTGGILLQAYKNIYENFYLKDDVEVHAHAYEGIRPGGYAQPEFTGKYLDICVQYDKRGDREALCRAKRVVDGILANQREDGYLGTYAPGMELDTFSVWNTTFSVLGLLSYYDRTGDEAALRGAVRAGEFIAGLFLRENPPEILDAHAEGAQHISIMIAMARLYARTDLPIFQKFMDWLIDHLEHSEMNMITCTDPMKLMSRKGIEIQVCYLGLLEYAGQVGRPEIVEGIKRYWQMIRDTQIRNTGNGCLHEFWTQDGNRPAMLDLSLRPNENCVAVGWIEFSWALFARTHEAKYLDAIEKTLFNHILGSLAADGRDFAYYQPNFGKKVFETRADYYACCRYRGMSLFAHLQDHLYEREGNAVIPAVYAESEYESEILRLRQRTDYPRSGCIHFSAESGGDTVLKLRIPAWCGHATAELDGQTLDAGAREGFLSVPLCPGTHGVNLFLDMPLFLEEGEIDGTPVVAAHYGPLLLAMDSHYGTPILGTTLTDTKFEKIPSVNGEAALVRFRCRGESEGAARDVIFTDYSSAGRLAPEDEFRVWVPIRR